MKIAVATGTSSLPPEKQHLRTLSQKLEAQFLAQMMKSAGVGKPRDTFGGGPGEDHFSGFLVQQYAESAVKAGGLGLAESIYRSLSMQDKK